jgi:hypothetical protein
MMDLKDFNIEDFEPYAEREHWSPRFHRWHKYQVKRPRLPQEKDKKRWVDRHRPSAFQTYTGRDNESIRKGFNNLLDFFEANGKLPNIVCVQGKPGTGKTSFCNTLLVGLVSALGLDRGMESRWVLRLSCKDLSSKAIDDMWTRINNFGNKGEDKDVPCNFRIIFLDDFHCIPIPAQMNFKQIMEQLAYKLRFLIVTRSVGKLAGYIEQRLAPTQTYLVSPIQEKHGLTILLNILFKNKVGFNREGLRELFTRNKHMDMSRIIDDAQELFLQRHFISKEEVMRQVAEKKKLRPEKPWIKPYAAVEPLSRCTVCTLFPPCEHLTEDVLIAKAKDVKAALPSYKGGMVCPEFARTGHCSMFNKVGHCSLSHPRTIHRTSKPHPRCAQCSLPWPCNHCTYSKTRNELIKNLDESKVRLARLKKINSPNPPGNVIIPLNQKFPEWQEPMKEIFRLCGGTEREDFLKDCFVWIDETFDVDHEVYYKKNKLVRFAFGPMLESPMLVDGEEMMMDDPLAMLVAGASDTPPPTAAAAADAAATADANVPAHAGGAGVAGEVGSSSKSRQGTGGEVK